MNADGDCMVCANKTQVIRMLEDIKKIIKIRKKFTNRFGRIVMEEVIDFYWNKQQKQADTLHYNENIYNDKINKIIIILNYLQNTNFFKIERTNKLFMHIVKSLERITKKMKSNQFTKKHIVQFITFVFDYKQIYDDLNFIIWILLNNTRCTFVFESNNF